ncbi:hypothetical protein AUJ46_05025 [Candidatus Peregrinibacteria bacterium CG1_02_54_53]|nr:MAG: hypothetical protein AUJ46_05025 [Candidatus Peregrinibacteria bacterium CG1_02_54_53]
MSRKSFTENNWRDDPWFKNLCKAVIACQTERQAADFLRDVGTLTELKDWSERLEIARRIISGKTYRKITEEMGVSTTTITRVARFLQSGSGYNRFLHKNQRHHHGTRVTSSVA